MAAEQQIAKRASATGDSPLLDHAGFFLVNLLRAEHPYMKFEMLHNIVTATLGTLEQELQDQWVICIQSDELAS